MPKWIFFEQDRESDRERRCGYVCAASAAEALDLFDNSPDVAITELPDDADLPPGPGPIFVTRMDGRRMITDW